MKGEAIDCVKVPVRWHALESLKFGFGRGPHSAGFVGSSKASSDTTQDKRGVPELCVGKQSERP